MNISFEMVFFSQKNRPKKKQEKNFCNNETGDISDPLERDLIKYLHKTNVNYF